MLFTIAQYAAAISTILILGGILVKWGIVVPIKAYIDHATYPISPNSNGGKSLPDAKMYEMDDRLVQVENLVTKPATRTRKTAK
jgi:hypothetical protein